jgi:hypothetical protein
MTTATDRDRTFTDRGLTLLLDHVHNGIPTDDGEDEHDGDDSTPDCACPEPGNTDPTCNLHGDYPTHN